MRGVTLCVLFTTLATLGASTMPTAAQEPKKDEPPAKYDKVVTLRRDGDFPFTKDNIPAYFRENKDVSIWFLKAPGLATKFEPKKGYTIIDPDGWEWKIDKAEHGDEHVCRCTKQAKAAKKP